MSAVTASDYAAHRYGRRAGTDDLLYSSDVCSELYLRGLRRVGREGLAQLSDALGLATRPGNRGWRTWTRDQVETVATALEYRRAAGLSFNAFLALLNDRSHPEIDKLREAAARATAKVDELETIRRNLQAIAA